MTGTELDRELAYLAECRAAMRRMVEDARLNVVVGEHVAGDRYSAERLGRHLKSLAKQLGEEPDGPVFFGRLDFATGEHAGRRYYIGRRHVSAGTGRQPLVLDWRAPVSRVFYQAGARDPQGLRVRRRFGWSWRPVALTGFEDEHLGRGDDTGTASRIVAAEIERPRVGPMRDIVATIQPEQDELVRAGLDDSICVQGAPGTGKTAVGLHRAAYLLYAHRQRLERAGVLVLGPNQAFLGYISAVLPSLGEVDVEQTTVERLLTRGPVRGADREDAVLVKHDARMATVLRRALYARVTAPAEPLAVPDGPHRRRVREEELRDIVAGVLREEIPYGVGRERVLARIVAVLRRQAEARGQTCGAAWSRKTGRAVAGYLGTVWPAVTPEEVVAGLLGDPEALAGAAEGILTPEEQAAILWRRPPRSAGSARWSAADMVLLDEVAGLLERPRGYGHVIVDEAQDLSPMQCRAVARRNEHGSLTVLGDLAQGTAPWAARDWRDRLGHLGKPDAQLIALTTGYRVPAVVVEIANRLLAELAVDVPATRSFRADGRLRVHRAGGGPAGLSAAVVAAVRDALGHDGSIAVITSDDALGPVTAALRSSGVEVADLDGGTAVGRVTAVPASLAKGLEYDHVVLVEPAEIVGAGARGPHRLYVALTRAVSRLDVLHAGPLPDWFPQPAGTAVAGPGR
ncbi:DNA helicase IV [Streptosporangium becharense]|uniref:DNA helicase IV n=1 Tax=Streptosporangium becharense TaxID=1816182 RepID=A0A7W9IC31_9ACTN|nr:AAA family ATPase [Streptosporangium becharense]MBB2913585.1 DNA helicase IV [Streptosporangium becharense]MBB5817666.1 DNA helicase IV [Streptosporangium becharense]